MGKNIHLWSVRVWNFKAIRDSAEIPLSGLNVFIGDNGSGKSSILEALALYRDISMHGLDDALIPWRGLENIWNKSVPHRLPRKLGTREALTNAIGVLITGRPPLGSFKAKVSISASASYDDVFIKSEYVRFGNEWRAHRDARGLATVVEGRTPGSDQTTRTIQLDDGELVPATGIAPYVANWQFLDLQPRRMGDPKPRRRSSGTARLESDGSSISEYLLRIRKQSPAAFEGILDALRFVLPYASDIQPEVTSEIQRMVLLRLSEGEFKIPGWALSSGTLRVLAILAVLRDPSPPPLLLVEEIENGLDPRTLNLVVDEMRNAVESGHTQIIATTHSPYLLDLLSLDHLILTQRIKGEPRFSRPSDNSNLREWSSRFTPGKLYTMGSLGNK